MNKEDLKAAIKDAVTSCARFNSVLKRSVVKTYAILQLIPPCPYCGNKLTIDECQSAMRETWEEELLKGVLATLVHKRMQPVFRGLMVHVERCEGYNAVRAARRN